MCIEMSSKDLATETLPLTAPRMGIDHEGSRAYDGFLDLYSSHQNTKAVIYSLERGFVARTTYVQQRGILNLQELLGEKQVDRTNQVVVIQVIK